MTLTRKTGPENGAGPKERRSLLTGGTMIGGGPEGKRLYGSEEYEANEKDPENLCHAIGWQSLTFFQFFGEEGKDLLTGLIPFNTQ